MKYLSTFLLVLFSFTLGSYAHADLLKKIGKGVKKVGKSIEKGAKKVGKGIKKGAKKAGKEIKKGAKSVGKFAGKTWKQIESSVKFSGKRGFLGYGNWCGKGGSGRAIDALDEACKQHDLCFEKNPKLTKKTSMGTYGACHCDRALIKSLKRVRSKLRKTYRKNKLRYAKAWRHWRGIQLFFQVQTCYKFKKKCKYKTVGKPKCKTRRGKKKCSKPRRRKVCTQKKVKGRAGR